MLPPLTLSPSAARRLSHDARRVAWSRDGDMAVAIGAGSEFAVIDRELDVVIDGRVRNADLAAAAVDPERGQLAFCGRDALITTDFEASAVNTHTHRPWPAGRGGDALFTEDGALLTVCPTTEGDPAVQLRDPESGLTHLEARPELPPASRIRLAPTVSPHRYLLWVATSSGLAQTFEVELGDALTVRALDALGETAAGPLVLGPGGDEAARVAEGGVERWRLGPAPKRVGAWRPEDDAPLFEDPRTVRVSHLAYVGRDQLLVHDEGSGRLYLLELESMLIAHEVRLDDLEPPLRALVPEHLGDGILYVHGAEPTASVLGLLEPPFGEVS